jgi:glyoxylase I family protein
MRPIAGSRSIRCEPGSTTWDLRVADPSQLDEREERFERLDVNHTPTVHADYGSVLTFRDPDMRQYEMFYRANHP